MNHTDSPADRAAQLAIARLFLDTELDDLDLKAIANDLRATGLQPSDLQRIYETQVAPACWRNLRAVPGGAWAGFDEAALTDAINRHRVTESQAGGFLQRLRMRRWTADTRDQWTRVLQFVETDLQLSPDK
ncbi:hypothetical protein OU995_12055 [Roseateles sp. SL47]|uniref:DUF7079 family protein n=1 Tax=Roseateles sp. SL47 TaxID=2995138 RepID=UPI002271026D|nr:hypothetical protein [Roseateles sp. SL47]WAC75382.1 hypothetical protein OU995_12055 [Roseateles sp. SL47]